MNEVIRAIKERRSIRRFKPDMPKREDIDAIIEAGLYAASGKGRQSPIIIDVSDPALRAKISRDNCRIGGWQEGFDPFYGAPVVLAVLADKECPTYIYDGSLVIGNMMLAAHSLGLGSIWIHRAKQEFETDEYKKMLESWGVKGNYEGIGHCATGFIDCEIPEAAPRREGRVFRGFMPRRFSIRPATPDDLDAIAAVEAECFPEAEAATREQFASRLEHYASHFWLMFDGGKLIAFVDGMVSDEPDLSDEMYAHPEMHNESGKWQMIFGVNTIPEYRRKGYAGQLIMRAIEDSRNQGRKGVVLTCKAELVNWYAKFGFVNEGVSESVHGGAVWYQMRLSF
ncbi:MAG: GNAT family N-acetyltransferase [Synergistaceae bacterium]|nr:GNAT family N-acetyltransferase [Synergistaceae bacterium]